MERYLVMNPDGSMRWIQTPHSKILEAFHEAVWSDCLEHVTLPYGFGCVVDDFGKMREEPRPINYLASRLYPGSFYGDPLVGPVVFVRIDLYDGEPDWAPLQDRDLVILELIIGKKVPAYG